MNQNLRVRVMFLRLHIFLAAVLWCLVLQGSAWGAATSTSGQPSDRGYSRLELVPDGRPHSLAANQGSGPILAAQRTRDNRRTRHGSKRRTKAKPVPPVAEPRAVEEGPRYGETQPGNPIPEPTGTLKPLPETPPKTNKPSDRVAGRVPSAVPDSDEVLMRPPKIEIVVSHSRHVLLVFKTDPSGTPTSVFQCRVGLGAPTFPTPKGTYYVTHIYDNDPWWIPPDNRAWAAGQSPSKKIYGGTMAPLLKKKALKPGRKEPSRSGDMIAGKVQLDDYGYRFHGTNAPRSIGRDESHGCVRMVPDDAGKVAALIKDQIGIVDRRQSENGTYVILRAPVILTIID